LINFGIYGNILTKLKWYNWYKYHFFIQQFYSVVRPCNNCIMFAQTMWHFSGRGALLIFVAAWSGIEPKALDLSQEPLTSQPWQPKTAKKFTWKLKCLLDKKIIWSSKDSSDELFKVITFVRDTADYYSLTKGTLLIFLKSGVEKLPA